MTFGLQMCLIFYLGDRQCYDYAMSIEIILRHFCSKFVCTHIYKCEYEFEHVCENDFLTFCFILSVSI
jgi:hypothetical protein